MNELHPRVKEVIATASIHVTVHDHAALPSEIKNPRDFAAALGYPISRITKTLFLKSRSDEVFAVAVCSMDRRLDFNLAAQAAGVRRLETASTDELSRETDYPRNGVSPLGLPDGVIVLVDKGLFDHPTVLIGGGAMGVEVELTPSDLVRLSTATVTAITA
ncbi:MAG TPA: YbaK/EbsC family protein [Kineosporiaceae bacterium]